MTQAEIRHHTGGETATWNGRFMTSYTKDDRRYEYSYNSDGMRTVKRVYEGDELVYTYTYIWDGDVLLGGRMEVTDADEPISIRYLYDESGELYGMDYNGNGYYGFIKNLQGDIVSIIPLDSESNVEVNMEYDAWGKPIIKQASSAAEGLLMVMLMAVTNVGYRGYFYDFDTGLYYLRSRYYDPEIGRFVNADDTDYLGKDQSPVSLNLFLYCFNNPITGSDPNGFWSITYSNIMFVYDRKDKDFKKQAKWMSKKYYKDKNVKYIYLHKIADFKRNWNSLKGKYINDIYLFLHGSPDILEFYYEQMKGSEIEKLSKLDIKGKIYLLSCHGGTKKSNNCIAWRFSKLVQGKAVRAVVNGSVYYRSATQLFSYKPLTKEKNAYWADFKYTKYKGKLTLTENSIGREWRYN